MEKSPSAARVVRVEMALESEPTLRPLLEKTQKVLKRNGDAVKVSMLSLNVASALAEQGKDACSSSKAEILQAAKKFVGAKSEKPYEGICILLQAVLDFATQEVGREAERRKEIVKNLLEEYKIL